MALHVVLIAKRPGRAQEGPRGERMDRSRELVAIAAVSGHVRHDSGGRLLLVDLPEDAEPKLRELLPGAELVPPVGDLNAVSRGLDAGEELFLEALRLRYSPEFTARKAARRFGESAEEQLLTTGSCVRGY